MRGVAAWRRCSARPRCAAMALIVGTFRARGWRRGNSQVLRARHESDRRGRSPRGGAGGEPSKTPAAVTPVVRASSTAAEPSSPTAELVRSCPGRPRPGQWYRQRPTWLTNYPRSRRAGRAAASMAVLLLGVGCWWWWGAPGGPALALSAWTAANRQSGRETERAGGATRVASGPAPRVCVLRSIRAASPMAYGWCGPRWSCPRTLNRASTPRSRRSSSRTRSPIWRRTIRSGAGWPTA